MCTQYTQTEAEEEALTGALSAAFAPPQLISSADPAHLRHPVRFDLIYADKASKLRVWRPQPLNETWFPAGDVFTVGTKRPPSTSHVWLLAASCLEEFTGYSSHTAGQPCNTRVLGYLSKETTVVGACEAAGDAQGAMGTVWLTNNPCAVPPFCPQLSCLTVPGATYTTQEAGTCVCTAEYLQTCDGFFFFTGDQWCVHGLDRVVQLCRPLLEGMRKALELAGGDAQASNLGTLDVMASGVRLRRVLQNRLAGCFVAAHQVFSAQYSKVG